MVRQTHWPFWLSLSVMTILIIFGALQSTLQASTSTAGAAAPQLALTPTPFFRFPVVENAPISGVFDHRRIMAWPHEDFDVRFYDGRISPYTSSGFYFYCYDIGSGNEGTYWVGCQSNATTEQGCANSEEMWYDNHTGIDFEYSDNWHTGNTCNLNQFIGVRRSIYAPAKGEVKDVEFNEANGNYIKMAHDINNNGNYTDDGVDSFYLHFDYGTIPLSDGDIVNPGQYIGLGAGLGQAWTPHLHFQVNKNGSPVDPYGWFGAGSDPSSPAASPLW